MAGLLADGWFYISTAGLLVSGVLFVFLLGQYRAASEAADLSDGAETEAAAAHEPISPVLVREEPKDAARVASVPPSKPAEKAAEGKSVESESYAGPERRKDPANATGGLSPAVVYLQQIKSELAELHAEMRTLSKRVDDELGGVSSRDEALIERLAELTRSVEALKSAAPTGAAVAAPASAPAPAPVQAVEPKPKKSAPKAEPRPPMEIVMPEAAPPAEPVVDAKPAPSVSPDETMRMELGKVIDAQLAPKTAPEAEAAPEEKPRRGPVWPV